MKLKGNKILGGKIVEGEALVHKESFSFFGDVNKETGDINVGENAGVSFKDKIFIFPQCKGSTLAPYIACDCKRNNVAPKAILCQMADGVVALSAILADIPTIDQFDVNIIETIKNGDRIRVDADNGIIEILK